MTAVGSNSEVGPLERHVRSPVNKQTSTDHRAMSGLCQETTSIQEAANCGGLSLFSSRRTHYHCTTHYLSYCDTSCDGMPPCRLIVPKSAAHGIHLHSRQFIRPDFTRNADFIFPGIHLRLKQAVLPGVSAKPRAIPSWNQPHASV
jgi:hypothetical protein